MRTVRIEKKFPDSKWTKFLSANARIRAVHTEVTSIAQALVDKHGLNGVPAQKLVESVVAAVLNSSLHDDGEDINVRLEDARSRLRTVVDARPEGAVRGLVSFLPDTAAAKNSFAVLYTQAREGQPPYLGITEGQHEHIDENLDGYFRDSAQIATTSGIVVQVQGNKVMKASGMLTQIIGGAQPEDVKAVLDADKEKLRQLANDFDESFGLGLVGVEFKKIEERELATFCTCSLEKIEDAMKMSKPGDNEPETLEAICDFCRNVYVIETAKIWPG